MLCARAAKRGNVYYATEFMRLSFLARHNEDDPGDEVVAFLNWVNIKGKQS